jgi:hypothetical protein
LQGQEELEDQEVLAVEDLEDVDVVETEVDMVEEIEEAMEVSAEEAMETGEEDMGETEEDVGMVDVVVEIGKVDMVEDQTETDVEVHSVGVVAMVVVDMDVGVVVEDMKEEEEVDKKEFLTAKVSRPLLIKSLNF